MTVTYDEAKLTPENIIEAVEGVGYGASLPGGAAENAAGGFRSNGRPGKARRRGPRGASKRRLISSIILLIPLMYVAMGPMMGLPARFSGGNGKFADSARRSF